MWAWNQTPDLDASNALQWMQHTATAERIARLPFGGPLLFLDVETTRNRIVEIAMVRFELGYTPWVFHTYVDPGNAGWNRSQKHWNTHIHGLTQNIVSGRPPFAQIASTVERAAHNATIVAHNVSFERRFLTLEFGSLARPWRRPTLDTLPLARTLRPELDDHKLDTLAGALDIRNPAPHRAIGDTVTTAWVMVRLCETYTGTRPLEAVLRTCRRDADGRPLNPWRG